MLGRLMALWPIMRPSCFSPLPPSLIVYLIARLLKASPLVAICFGVLPLVVADIVQHPDSPTGLLALLR